MKKEIKTISIDGKIYNKFKLYANCLGRSVSSLIEEHMREIISKLEKEK